MNPERVVGTIARLERVVRHLLAAIMIALVGLNLAGAIGRYSGAFSLSWGDEAQLFTMIWGVGLAVFLVSLRKGHLTMDLLFVSLPRGAQRGMEVLIAVGSILVMGFVLVQSWRFVRMMAAIDQRSMAAQIPMSIPHSAILAALGLMIVALLARAYLALRGIDLTQALERYGRRESS